MRVAIVIVLLVILIIVVSHRRLGSQPETFSVDAQFTLSGIRGLVFSGAGTLGYAIVGAVEELQRSGLDINSVEYFAGTSAGSMIACMLACRISIDDIRTYVMNSDIKSMFLDTQNTTAARVKRRGLFDGSKIQDSIEDFLREHTQCENLTFNDVYEKYGTTLVVTAVDIKNFSEPVYFSRFTYPHVPVSLAARASSSIPFIFDPVRIDGRVLVDGGALDLFPIKELQKYVPLQNMTGVYLDDDIKYTDAEWKKWYHYMGLSSKMVRRRMSRNRLTREERQRFVVVSFHDRNDQQSSINFDMSSDTKKSIFDVGVRSARHFLHGSEFQV
jgi:NTE family protein